MPTRRFDNLDPERKRQILDAACAVFAESGYEAASLNDIIRAAGISKGSLYYYFEDKLDLFLAVVVMIRDDYIDSFGGILKGDFSDDFWSDMDSLYMNSLKYMRECPEIIKIGRDARHLMTSPVAPGPFKEIMSEGFRIYRDIIRKGQEMGEIRTDVPLDLLVSALFYMGEGMDFWFVEKWDKLSEKELAGYLRHYVDFAKRVAAPSQGGCAS